MGMERIVPTWEDLDIMVMPYASSLCGACTEACPVKIPLHELLIEHRRQIVAVKGGVTKTEKLAMKGFEIGVKLPSMFKLGTKAAPYLLKPFTSKGKITKGPGSLKD